MNEKGFGLKEFIILLVVIFVCIIIIVGLFNSMFTKEEKEKSAEEVKQEEKVTYKTLENRLKKGAERYQNDNYSGNIEDTVTVTLEYEMLKKEGYVDKIKDIETNKECTGYVKFTQDKARISYEAYLNVKFFH